MPRGDRLDRQAHVGQQFDRMTQDALAELDQTVEIVRGDALTAQHDRGLDHRQRHALGAVAEQLEIAPLGLEQALVHARIAEVDVGPEHALEFGVCGLEIVLAAPQRIVGVEADQVDARHAQAAPGPLVSFRPRIPTTISPIQASRGQLADSANSTMPRIAVPTAPIPVQIA